jgi:hypothetical protein
MKRLKKFSPVAQSVERLAVNQHVRGSSPRWGANTSRLQERQQFLQLFYFSLPRRKSEYQDDRQLSSSLFF